MSPQETLANLMVQSPPNYIVFSNSIGVVNCEIRGPKIDRFLTGISPRESAVFESFRKLLWYIDYFFC